MKKSIDFIKQKFWLLFIVVSIILLSKTCSQNKKEKIALDKNGLFTIGQVIGSTGGKHSVSIYRYYVNNKEFINRGIKDVGDKYGFRLIKYDKTNPINSAIVDNKRYSYREILNKYSIDIKGTIDKIIKYRDNYYDLKITYIFSDCEYTFKTRLDTKDLGCNPDVNCYNSEIHFKISSIYPRLNTLYIKSIDRAKKIKSNFKLNIDSSCD